MENLSSGQKSSFTRLRNQIKDEFEALIGEIREKRDQIEEMRLLLLEDDDDGISIQSEVLKALLRNSDRKPSRPKLNNY
ncbi:hypothetical protein [Vibrio alginolyticus]|uniref:hypothetical protein n=1 Tax=Vibrio alginolyticus TaxID=663 RepID=UPI0021D09A34